jgi:hypothetical protein
MIAARVQAAAVAPSVEPSSPNNNAAEIQPSDSSGVEPSVSFFDKVKVLVTLQILSRKWFQMLILLNIIITSILAGIETYGSHGRAVQTADTVILVIFGFEVALRIFAECPQPWKYFIGKDWLSNWFDFAVVAMGIFASGISNDTFSVSLLPVLRLMRLTKLVSKISAMKKILSGLAGGIKSASKYPWGCLARSLICFMMLILLCHFSLHHSFDLPRALHLRHYRYEHF